MRALRDSLLATKSFGDPLGVSSDPELLAILKDRRRASTLMPEIRSLLHELLKVVRDAGLLTPELQRQALLLTEAQPTTAAESITYTAAQLLTYTAPAHSSIADSNPQPASADRFSHFPANG